MARGCVLKEVDQEAAEGDVVGSLRRARPLQELPKGDQEDEEWDFYDEEDEQDEYSWLDQQEVVFEDETRGCVLEAVDQEVIGGGRRNGLAALGGWMPHGQGSAEVFTVNDAEELHRGGGRCVGTSCRAAREGDDEGAVVGSV
ncbi:hypothetical protein D9613_007463 [Agrocybe pediades]|uniref:Uncharacterized protein n=1 Tax=Agrocybe pediades TaxID=84607 RepID=A0A8H4QML8_9AGAR|nr:hypothetical protein D9613_007463 [Agrocybe pediades]